MPKKILCISYLIWIRKAKYILISIVFIIKLNFRGTSCMFICLGDTLYGRTPCIFVCFGTPCMGDSQYVYMFWDSLFGGTPCMFICFGTPCLGGLHVCVYVLRLPVWGDSLYVYMFGGLPVLGTHCMFICLGGLFLFPLSITSAVWAIQVRL